MEREEPSEQPCREGDTINPQNPTIDVLLNTSVNTRATMTSLQAIPSIGGMFASPMVTLATMTCEVTTPSARSVLIIRIQTFPSTTSDSTPTFFDVFSADYYLPAGVTIQAMYIRIEMSRIGLSGESLQVQLTKNGISQQELDVNLDGITFAEANISGLNIGYVTPNDFLNIKYSLVSPTDPDYFIAGGAVTLAYRCDE